MIRNIAASPAWAPLIVAGLLAAAATGQTSRPATAPAADVPALQQARQAAAQHDWQRVLDLLEDVAGLPADQQAQLYALRSRARLRLGQHDAALAEARRAVAADGCLAAAHFALAEVHDALDHQRQAQREYKKAIRLAPQRSEYKLALARHYRRLDDLTSAQRYFQAALSDDPTCGPAAEGLIDCYLRGGKLDVARNLLERVDLSALPADAVRRIETMMRFAESPFSKQHLAELRRQFEQNPDDLATARLLAGGLYYRGQIEPALQVIERALRIDPDDYNLLSLAAVIHSRRGEFRQAIALRERLRAAYPNRRAVLEPLADLYQYEFEPDKSRAILEHLLSLTDDDELRNRYRQRIGDSYLTFRQFDQALQYIDRWMAEDPASREALVYTKLSVLHSAGRSDEAFELLEQWIAQAGGSLQSYDTYASFAVALGHPEAAVERLQRWLADEPGNAVLAERLVEALLAAKQPERALEVARDFEGDYAASLLRRMWMGRCEAALGKIDTAVKEFQALLAERNLPEPLRQRARQQLIVVLYEAQSYDQALELCDKWLRQADDDATRAQVEGMQRWLCYAAGKTEQYERLLEEQWRRNPDDPLACNDLGYHLADSGRDLPRALELIRKAVIAEPLNAAYLDSLGWAYYKTGRLELAHRYLSRGTRLRDGQDAVIYDHLGDTCWRRGDRTAARAAWERALELADKQLAEGPRADVSQAREALKSKLAALAAGRQPPVAPMAEAAEAEQTP